MMHLRHRLLPATLSMVLVVATACGNSEPVNDEPVIERDRKEVLAPIDAAELTVRDTMPVEYTVHITSGLPSGCAEFERIDIARDGRRIDLTVWNTMPADDDIACTMIYRTAQHTVELGSDFESGEDYQVYINEETVITLTAR